MIDQALRLRPLHPGDEAFLRRLYAEVRAPELALMGFEGAAADAFLDMQFDAQQRHYQATYPQARCDIVERAGIPLGRLYVASDADAIHVIDIALLAAYRGQGIGSTLLRTLQDEAARDDRRLGLHVAQHNPAHALYLRLGFIETDLEGMYRSMQWRPAPPAVPTRTTP